MLLSFSLGGKFYLNNTVAYLEDIGEGENALVCMSSHPFCCGRLSPFRGEFFYPNGTMVPIYSRQFDLYRNRASSFIRLHQRPNVANQVEGKYRCEIRDNTGTVQRLFINLLKRQTLS